MRSRHAASSQRVIVFAFRQCANTQMVFRFSAITTRRKNAEGHRFFCASTMPKHACRGLSFLHVLAFAFRQRQSTRKLSFVRSQPPAHTQRGIFFCNSTAPKRRGWSFVRSRHAAATTQKRVVIFAFQRQNTQRVVVRAITIRRAHAEGRRLCVSTTPKHAEGCRSCDHDTPRLRRGSSFLRFDNAKTPRGFACLHFFERSAAAPANPTRFCKTYYFQEENHEIHHNPSRHKIH